ncbi:FAD-dependent oxidoreductase [Microbacterium sp. ZW T5_56]|uniref:glycerol-3-phosphate dehydrogenase/oxidase n=1 Tax=Microbacterium sp. ZW T5_56 TaxID=3378081 RepID=UPI0038521AD0
MMRASASFLPDAVTRRGALEHAADGICDVLVVGAGITGVGVALDAASRGLSVVLIEAEDLAFGTSRWSSKLVHGGLRYLATGDFATAVESARERHLLMTRIAPHLIRSLPQLIPFGPAVDWRQRFGGAVGMAMGDLLRMRAGTPHGVLARPRLIRAGTARRLAPALEPHQLRGGVLGADGQLVDDARLVVTVARTAAAHGATILTRVRAERLHRDGAAAVDQLTGERVEIRARAVINATGVWAGALDDSIHVRPSRGTHLVVDAAALGNPTAAVMVPHPGSLSRFVFALPSQLGRVIIGLTDEDAPGPIPAVPASTETEIDFLVATVNQVLRNPLSRESVRGTFAGLRPLIDTGEAESSADISRRHLVTLSPSDFVNVLGGKLTTYRRMAEDAVDLACRTFGLPVGPSTTATLPLVGATAPSAETAATELRWRFGAEASIVLSSAQLGNSSAIIAPGVDVLRAEVEFAVRAEGALTADDVLDRRTRIGLVPADRAAAAPAVSELVEDTLSSLTH